MIINEGFLDNAKKIASNGNKNNGIKVPEIRRENYEYHIDISFVFSKKSNRDIDIISKIVFKNSIFKEYGNVYENSDTEDKDHNIYNISFDSDMFITVDTVYDFIYSLFSTGVNNNLDISITDNSGGIIFSETFDAIILGNISNDIIKRNSFILDNRLFGFLSIKKIFDKFGFPNGRFFRWIKRNEIINVVLFGLFEFKNCILYPISIKNPDRFYEMLASARDIKTASILSESQYRYNNAEKIKSELIKNKISDFILSYDEDFNIVIQTTYPILFEKNEYKWFIFKIIRSLISSRKEYSYMHEIINESKSNKIVFSGRYDITDEEPKSIDGNSIKNNFREISGIDDSMSIIIEYSDCPDSETLTEKITNSGFINRYANIDTETTYSHNSYIYRAALDVKLSTTPENIYEFIQLFKDSSRIIIIINYKGSSTIIDTKYVTYNKIYEVSPDKIYDRYTNSLIYSFNVVMNNLGIEENDIIKWNIENNITMIKKNTQKNMNTTSAAYISFPEYIIKDMELSIQYAYSLNYYGIFDYEDDADKEIIRIINESGTHKFIIQTEETESEDYPSEKEIHIEITTLYPIMYKGKYIYPTFTAEIYKSDELYKYYKKMETKLKRYKLQSFYNKTSDIKFAKIQDFQVIK